MSRAIPFVNGVRPCTYCGVDKTPEEFRKLYYTCKDGSRKECLSGRCIKCANRVNSEGRSAESKAAKAAYIARYRRERRKVDPQFRAAADASTTASRLAKRASDPAYNERLLAMWRETSRIRRAKAKAARDNPNDKPN